MKHRWRCRAATLDALSVLSVGEDSGVAGGEGAIYFWAKLPQGHLFNPCLMLLCCTFSWRGWLQLCYHTLVSLDTL